MRFLISKTTKKLRLMTRVANRWLGSAQPVYVFHHLPKCGGTSVRSALQNWFQPVLDYDQPGGKQAQPQINIRQLQPDQILCGHFDLPGLYLEERYPEVLRDQKRYRTFTFIREPLQTKISLYYYEKKHAPTKNTLLENHLLGRNNYLAERFPCTLENYRQVVDRYFFVGIAEEFQLAFDMLADLIGKLHIALPYENTVQRDNQEKLVSPDLIAKFKEANQLDYALYNYCREKFNRLKIQMGYGLVG